MTAPTLANAYDKILEVNTGTSGSPTWTKVRFIRNLKYTFPPITFDVTTYDDEGSPNVQKTGANTTVSFDVQQYRVSTTDPAFLPEAEQLRKAADPDHLGADAIKEFRLYDRLGADEAYRFSATVAWDRSKTGATEDAVAAVTLSGVGKPTVISNPTVDQPIPTITSVSPTTGPAGTEVTLTGTRMNTLTLIKFGTSNAVVVPVDDTHAKTVVPAAGSAGAQNITAINPAGTSTPATTFTKS